MRQSDHTISNRIRIRAYRPADRPAIVRLHTGGVLVDVGSTNDSSDNFADMRSAYFSRSQDHFWVAEARGRIVGMIGVVEKRPHVAMIRRLRVAPSSREAGIARRLVTTALRHCRQHDALKVILDAPCQSRRAIQFLGDLGFQYSRTCQMDGRNLIEFYLSPYKCDESLKLCDSERNLQ